MIVNKQHISLKIIFISITLLIGQYAALAHSVEHPFHEAAQACKIYVALEQSKDGLMSACNTSNKPLVQLNNSANFTSTFLFHAHALYSIRAPPSLRISLGCANLFSIKERFFMRTTILAASVALALSYSHPVLAANDFSSLKEQLDQLKLNYEQRIQALESRLKAQKLK